MSLIRGGVADDLPEIRAIQAASPAAAQWEVSSYLGYDLRVLAEGGRIAGFAVARQTAPGEWELLNLAVAPRFRRRGVGRRLVESIVESARASSEPGQTAKTGLSVSVFTEVRASNQIAREFYNKLGFHEVGTRKDYYYAPRETAIVMKFHSC